MDESLEPPAKCQRVHPPMVEENVLAVARWCRHHLETDPEPVSKRPRVGVLTDLRLNDMREATIRALAERIVHFLHNSASVEDAVQRCAHVLAEFEGEIRQTVAREMSSKTHDGCEQPAETPQPQPINRVLMRAVYQLAERCRRLEAKATEAESLRQTLGQSLEAQQRLQHSNEVLQEHIRIHLRDCSC